MIRDVPRQVGLTARYGIEGPAQAAEIFTEPLRNFVVNPILEDAGLPRAAPLSRAARDAAGSIGLPEPRDGFERVIGDASRTVAGVNGIASLAQKGAQATAGLTSNALQQMAARPGVQAVGAAGAGASGGAVRESGGSPAEQFGASSPKRARPSSPT
jgi:hypothetical protein